MIKWFNKITGVTDRRNTWRQAAEEMGGKFIQGSWFVSDTLEYIYTSQSSKHSWKITLCIDSGNEDSSTFHEICVTYVSPDGFECRLYEENFLSPLSKKLGFQDIVIGDRKFDKSYVIKGNDVEKTKMLLNSQPIKDCIYKEQGIRLYIQQIPKPHNYVGIENVHRIIYSTANLLETPERIVQLFTLYCLILERLENIGSAKGYMK